jgi:hypothetical protein
MVWVRFTQQDPGFFSLCEYHAIFIRQMDVFTASLLLQSMLPAPRVCSEGGSPCNVFWL